MAGRVMLVMLELYLIISCVVVYSFFYEFNEFTGYLIAVIISKDGFSTEFCFIITDRTECRMYVDLLLGEESDLDRKG